MKFEILPPLALDASDDTFSFRRPGPPPELAESVRLHGVLCPLVVRALPDRLQIVSGRRRFDAASEAKAIPCFVHEESGLTELQALELLVEENRFGPGFTAVEAGRLLDLFRKAGRPEEELVSRVAPRLGLPQSPEHVRRHLAAAALDPSVTDHPAARDGLLLSLARLPAGAARTLFFSWVVPERPSVQDVRAAVEWIADLALKRGRDESEVLARVLPEGGGQGFLKALKNQRFPAQAAVEEAFSRACASLPRGIQAKRTPTDAVCFTLTARTPGLAAESAVRLAGATEALEAIFEAASGR